MSDTTVLRLMLLLVLVGALCASGFLLYATSGLS
jgi:hypothetical protein